MDETPRKTGLILSPDDLTVGEYFAVVGCKCHDNPVPIGGMAFEVKAINLPYLVGKLVCDPQAPTVTLDARFLNFMRVDEAFVEAQKPNQADMVMVPAQLLAMLRSKA